MKKLIIAAAIVCVATITQAGAIKWSSTSMTGASQIFGPDGATLINTWAGTTGNSISSVILMNVADYSQSELLTALRKDEYTWGAGALDTTSVNSSSKITAKTSSQLDGLGGTSINVYYAILATDAEGNKSVLISSAKPADIAVGTDSTTVSWGNDGGTFSALKNGDAAYSAAGWYAVSSAPEPIPGGVPEPTSGLLVLLGVAGLALRRRA